jgi:anti-anti-sigma regulatory factor
MGPHRHTTPLSVVHSDADPGRSGLQLAGELDISTVALLEDELTRRDSPPSFIDLSQLRFLDLTGLRALLRAVESDVVDTAPLVGATGVVRRLIELAQRIDGPAHPPAPSLPTPALATEPGRRRPGRGKPAAHGARPAPRSGNADVARSAATADRR